MNTGRPEGIVYFNRPLTPGSKLTDGFDCRVPTSIEIGFFNLGFLSKILLFFCGVVLVI